VILLLAVVLGLVIGLALAIWRGQTYQLNGLHFTWLAVIAFIPQMVALYLPSTRNLITRDLASACLIGSQAALLAFAWLNRKLPGMLILAVGLILNLAVIIANGGFMPISPDTIKGIAPDSQSHELTDGERFGTKDVMLSKQETQLEWLSDRFRTPVWSPFQAVYSLGDVVIALGIFWILVQPRSNKPFVKELQPL